MSGMNANEGMHGTGTMDQASPAPPRALVVDDEPDIASLVRAALEGEGYEVRTAGTAAEAFDRLRKEDFGLLILDVSLPDMDGIHLHSRLRALDPMLAGKTIFISAWVKSPEARDYLASTAHFLAKPFSIRELIDLARSLS